MKIKWINIVLLTYLFSAIIAFNNLLATKWTAIIKAWPYIGN